jgi:hypothetical protein
MKKILLFTLIFLTNSVFGQEINLVCKDDNSDSLPTMKLSTYSIKKLKDGSIKIYQNDKNIAYKSEYRTQKLLSSSITNDEIKFEVEHTNEEKKLGDTGLLIPKGWEKSSTTISRINGDLLIITFWKGGMREGLNPKFSNPIYQSGKCEQRQPNKF